MRRNIFPLFLYQSNDITVITKAKVASRYMSELFMSSENPYIYIDSNINNYENGNQKYFQKLNLLLKDKSNNDVYFLYRNPLKRFYSGLIEDTLRIYDYNTIFENYHLNYLIDRYSINLYELQLNLGKGDYNFFIENQNYINFTKDIIKNWIEWHLKIKPIYTDHTEPYMDIIYSFSNKLKNSNIFFINIDDNRNNLENIFKKYNSLYLRDNAIDDQKSLSHSKFYNFLENIFNENDEYSKFKNTFLSIDNLFYELLESNDLNILKKQ
jgi:hypothetical protein